MKKGEIQSGMDRVVALYSHRIDVGQMYLGLQYQWGDPSTTGDCPPGMTSPGTRTLWWRPRLPIHATNGDTTPSLRRQLRVPLYPLTRAGRRTRPGWYLAARHPEISAAPSSASPAEKMKRHIVMAAICLWWPIARLLTVFFLWRDGIHPRSSRVWYRALDADVLQDMGPEASTVSSERFEEHREWLSGSTTIAPEDLHVPSSDVPFPSVVGQDATRSRSIIQGLKEDSFHQLRDQELHDFKVREAARRAG